MSVEVTLFPSGSTPPRWACDPATPAAARLYVLADEHGICEESLDDRLLETLPLDKIVVGKRHNDDGTWTLTLDTEAPGFPSVYQQVPVPETLACMASHGDGSHRGLGDWYDSIEAGIQEALNLGPTARWTTGWYGSKHEIASACITAGGDGTLHIEASVSDDFDTVGTGEETIPHTTALDVLREAIDKAWQEAEDNQKDNCLYRGFKVLHAEPGHSVYVGGVGQGEATLSLSWVETYIQPVAEGHCFKEPPGDNYHKWGWQGDGGKIPPNIKRRFKRWIDTCPADDASLEVQGWTIQPWEG